VTEQEFGQAMTRPQEIGADVLATAEKITGRLFLLGRDVNRRQRPSTVEHSQLTRITAVRFDAIARPPRDQGRRNDVAGHLLRRKGAL
jgi:hypothetical protein